MGMDDALVAGAGSQRWRLARAYLCFVNSNERRAQPLTQQTHDGGVARVGVFRGRGDLGEAQSDLSRSVAPASQGSTSL